MRVLVCGGRKYNDRDHIWNTLCEVNSARGPISCIIHGAATGADSEAMIRAQTVANVKHAPFVADSHTHGRSAGPIRNQRMIDEGKPDLIVAFPGGKVPANMVRRAKEAAIEVVSIRARGEEKGNG